MLPDSDVEIRKSRIEGLGVFALRDFAVGETVFEWDTSNTISDEQYERLPEDQQHLVTRYRGEWLFMLEPMSRVNHSCNANTVSDDGRDVATKEIHAGEEITSDYRSEMKAGEQMKCRCKTPNCIGYIVGTGQ